MDSLNESTRDAARSQDKTPTEQMPVGTNDSTIQPRRPAQQALEQVDEAVTAAGAPTPVQTADAQKAQPAATIPREVFNYALIAFVCLIVGALIGWMGRGRVAADSEAVIDRAVQTVVAAVPRGPTPVPTRDPNARFEVLEKDNPSKGIADPAAAPITIIEFGDFRCGFCRRFNDETLPLILENYADSVRYVYRDYPILGPDSLEAALAGECAADQNLFWEFHEYAYANQNALTAAGIPSLAEAVGLEMEQFNACYSGRIHEQSVVEDYLDGQTLGITGTPTFFINGKIIQGAQPYQVFAQAIDEELARINAS